MKMVDLIDNLIDACKLVNSEKKLIANTDTSCEYMLTGEYLELPAMIKSKLRNTSYSDDLMDTDNNTIAFRFDDVIIEGQLTITVVMFKYIDTKNYNINLQVLNYIKHDQNGRQILV